MSPKYHNFEIALIYFLLLIPWPPTNVIKILCSRDNSRLVRKIVRAKWTPILDKHQVKLPLECPLHQFRDLFAPRQDAKQRDRPTQWTCRLCGKSFYQEKHLDLHFDTRHKTIINEAEDSVCLADFCDIMRCEVFQTEDSSSLKFGDQHIVTDIEVWGDSLGQNSALAKANAAYMSLIPIRTSTLGATRAAKVQNRQLLHDNKHNGQSNEHSQSDVIAEHLSGDQPKSASEKLLAKLKGFGGQGHAKNEESDNAENEETSDSKLVNETEGEEGIQSNDNNTQDEAKENNDDAENASASPLTKGRANCKADELAKLKASCETLLRSCIGGLVLSMTDQAFKEMEEEMNKAVCWYLTCERYWEDGPLEPRAFPWGLIVILIFVLSTGICFCYYIIWILFDSEETTINANHYGYIGGGSGSIYMPSARHYHVDYVTSQHDINEATAQQQYYYQQQQQQQQQQAAAAATTRDLYPESVQYHRHSPRHYIAEQQQQQQQQQQQRPGTPSTSGRPVPGSSSNANTPLRHHHHHHQQQHPSAYPQDIIDRREYANNMGRRPTVGSTTAAAAAGTATAAATTTSTTTTSSDGIRHHYNTHPRPLDTRHRHVGSSQQSLRASSSTHEIVQNEMSGVGQNEHYIYVTYPPDLKKRYFEKYE